ncbi:unnamed protein product, partial [Owenia fusiformis]
IILEERMETTKKLLGLWILILQNVLHSHVESANPCAKTSAGTVLDDPLYPQCGFLLCVYHFPYVYRCAPGTYWNSQSKQCLLDTHQLCYNMDTEVSSKFMDRVPTSVYKEPPASSKKTHIVDYSPGDRISLTHLEDGNTLKEDGASKWGSVDSNGNKATQGEEPSDVVYLGHNGIFVNRNDPILKQPESVKEHNDNQNQKIYRKEDDLYWAGGATGNDVKDQKKYKDPPQNKFGVKDVIKRLYKTVTTPSKKEDETYLKGNDVKENNGIDSQASEQVSEYRAVDGDIVWHIVPTQNTFFGKRDPTFKYEAPTLRVQEKATVKNKNGRISKHRPEEDPQWDDARKENILEDPNNNQMWQSQGNQVWQTPSNQVWQSGQGSQTMMNQPTQTNQVWQQQPSNQVLQQQPSNQVWQQQPSNQVWQQQPSNQVWQQQPSNQVWQQQPSNQVWQQQPSIEVWQQQPSNQAWQQTSNQAWQQTSNQAWQQQNPQTQASTQQIQTQVIQCSQPNDIGKLFPDATNRCRFLNCEWPHLQKITIMECAPGTAYDDTTMSCDIHDPGC